MSIKKKVFGFFSCKTSKRILSDNVGFLMQDHYTTQFMHDFSINYRVQFFRAASRYHPCQILKSGKPEPLVILSVIFFSAASKTILSFHESFFLAMPVSIIAVRGKVPEMKRSLSWNGGTPHGPNAHGIENRKQNLPPPTRHGNAPCFHAGTFALFSFFRRAQCSIWSRNSSCPTWKRNFPTTFTFGACWSSTGSWTTKSGRVSDCRTSGAPSGEVYWRFSSSSRATRATWWNRWRIFFSSAPK